MQHSTAKRGGMDTSPKKTTGLLGLGCLMCHSTAAISCASLFLTGNQRPGFNVRGSNPEPAPLAAGFLSLQISPPTFSTNLCKRTCESTHHADSFVLSHSFMLYTQPCHPEAIWQDNLPRNRFG